MKENFDLYLVNTLYALYQRRNMLADPIVVAQYGFLYSPYRPHAYWWEAQIIMHKMALTAGLVLLYQSAIVQCSMAFAIAVMSWAMHSSYKPFKSGRLNMLQHWCLFATAIAFVGNLAYQCTANSTTESTSKGIVKWFITFMFAGAIIRVLVGGVQETLSAWKNYEDIMLGKRQEKKLKRNWRQRKKQEIKKTMPSHRKRVKQNAKYLGIHNMAGAAASGGGKKSGGFMGLAKASKKAKVTMVSV